MELKVRALDEVQEKSVQEVEQELLDKAEGKTEEAVTENVQVQEAQVETQAEKQPKEEVVEDREFGEQDVLSYIKNRYNKEITSVDDLFEQTKSNEELPEDVSAFLEYKKKTGRGISDYMKLNQDFDSMTEDQLLKEYFKLTEEGLDDDDISIMMEDFSYDEELDDETTIKKTRLNKKKAVTKAKKYFNEQKEMYKQPLESSTVGISESERKQVEAAKQYIEQSKNLEEEMARRREVFEQQTSSLFDKDFKGFDFKIGDKELVYTPGDTSEIKKTHLNPANFISRFVNEDNVITNISEYHKSMAVAMNPEKFAKFFYEQGKSDATEDVARKMKNVQMDERKAPEVTTKGGMQVRSVNPDSGRGLKIKNRNK